MPVDRCSDICTRINSMDGLYYSGMGRDLPAIATSEPCHSKPR